MGGTVVWNNSLAKMKCQNIKSCPVLIEIVSYVKNIKNSFICFKSFTKNYEIKNTDRFFCGPIRKYLKAR